MPIRYRYTGKQWTTIDGDDYTLDESGDNGTPSTGCCFNDCAASVSWDLVYFFNGQYVRSQEQRKGIGERILFNPAKPFAFTGSRSTDNGDGTGYAQDIYLDLVDEFGNRSVENFTIQKGFGEEILESSAKVVFYRVDGSPNVCGECTFKVFKNELIVYEETRSQCPEVEIVNQQECSEGTCEVECGDTICCYGSDGVSVFNFPKP